MTTATTVLVLAMVGAIAVGGGFLGLAIVAFDKGRRGFGTVALVVAFAGVAALLAAGFHRDRPEPTCLTANIETTDGRTETICIPAADR